MQINLLKAVLFLYFIMPILGFSGVTVEPFYAFSLGATGQRLYINSKGQNVLEDFTAKANIYGLRLGYNYHGIMIGGEYFKKPKFTFREETTIVTNLGPALAEFENKFEGRGYGAYIGYQADNGFRFWYTKYLKQKYKDVDGSNSGDERNGDGWSIGVGCKAIHWLALNLQATKYSLNKGVSAGISGSIDPSYEITEWHISISFPFDIFNGESYESY